MKTMFWNSETISKTYSKHQDTTITFSQSVIKSIGLNTGAMAYRCSGEDFPCILYSTSFREAKLLAPINKECLEKLQAANRRVSLRFVFHNTEENREVTLYIKVEFASITKYKGSDGGKNIFFISARFLMDPPSDFIKQIGIYLENKNKAEQRIHERVVINDLLNREMEINPTETYLFIEGNGKKCILSEISIFSAKVIISGRPEEFKNKTGLLIIKAGMIDGMGEMLGKVMRISTVSVSASLYSLIIVFDQEKVPPLYKMWIGECLEKMALSK